MPTLDPADTSASEMPDTEPAERRAIHEAGHVIVAYALGADVLKVAILPGTVGAGEQGVSQWNFPSLWAPRELARRRIAASLAGQAFEDGRFNSFPARLGGGGQDALQDLRERHTPRSGSYSLADYELAQQIAIGEFDSGFAIGMGLVSGRRLAERVLASKKWSEAGLRVADALVVKQMLTAEEFKGFAPRRARDV